MGVESATVPPQFSQQVLVAASEDCFGPPKEPCECGCLHCHRQFMSDQMWFQATLERGGKIDGFWMCPTPNCGGAGFKFDIFPTDPAHPANAGWHSSDDEGEEWDETDKPSDEMAAEYDPAEPGYSEMDEMNEDDEIDDDIEGEEWKHGLQPGEALPESPEMTAARQRWEEDEKRYDLPDERPRWIDRSDEPEPPAMTENDIPF